MNYLAMYKCRLCGKVWAAMAKDHHIVNKIVNQHINSGNSECLESIPMIQSHRCGDAPDGYSPIGIADFQGFEPQRLP